MVDVVCILAIKKVSVQNTHLFVGAYTQLSVQLNGFYCICRIWWMKTASPDEVEVSIFNFVF